MATSLYELFVVVGYFLAFKTLVFTLICLIFLFGMILGDLVEALSGEFFLLALVLGSYCWFMPCNMAEIPSICLWRVSMIEGSYCLG